MKTLRHLTILAGILAASSSVFADGKYVANSIPTDFVAINDFKDGTITVALPNGNEVKVKFAEVTSMSLNNNKDFTDAEKIRNKPADAARFYSSAIRNSTKAERKVIQARAIKIFDEAGLYADAVVNFMELYTANPSADTWSLHPTKVPTEAKSQYLAPAATAISAKINGAPFKSDPEATKNLNSMLLEIYNAQGNTTEATKIAKTMGVDITPAPVEPKTGGTVGVANPTNPNPVQINAALPANNNNENAAVKAYKDLAEQLKKNNQMEEAAATYVRIYAYYPTRQQDASEALLAAADIQRGLNRKDEANRLYNELMTKYAESAAALKAKSIAPLK